MPLLCLENKPTSTLWTCSYFAGEFRDLTNESAPEILFWVVTHSLEKLEHLQLAIVVAKGHASCTHACCRIAILNKVTAAHILLAAVPTQQHCNGWKFCTAHVQLQNALGASLQ